MSKTESKASQRDWREWPSVKQALDPYPLLTDVERRYNMATPIKVMMRQIESGKREFNKDDFLSYVELLGDSGKYRLGEVESVAFPWREAFNRVSKEQVDEDELCRCLWGCLWVDDRDQKDRWKMIDAIELGLFQNEPGSP